jgi:hypothetical protein
MGLKVVPGPLFVERASVLRRGFVAMEDLSGRGEELDRFLDREYDRMDGRQRHALSDEFAHFLTQLFKKSVFHRDLKACNVFRLCDDTFRLLDVEDVGFCGPSEEDLEGMLVQLATSVPSRISISDRLRFLARLTRGLPLDRKALLERVAAISSGHDVVYEGVSGLRIESWPVRPKGSRSPFSRLPQ